MPETCNSLSKDEAQVLLNFFNQNECFIIDSEPNPALLEIILKIYLRSNIVNVGFPKNANIKKDGLHVSLRAEGKKQLQSFLKK